MYEIIEIFGMRVKIVPDSDENFFNCACCAFYNKEKNCCSIGVGSEIIPGDLPCTDENGKCNRHFILCT